MIRKKIVKTEVLNLDTYKTLNRDNAYFKFIQDCQEKTYPEDVITQEHHIIPQYVYKEASPDEIQFMEGSGNKINLSVEDHHKAHFLLHEIYGNLQDLGACYLIENHSQEGRTVWQVLGAKASHKAQKKAEKNLWDQSFQKKMADRSMARPDALQIRSDSGKIGGRKRNEGIAIKTHERFLFLYEGKEILCVLNCSTGGDVLRELKKFLASIGQETKLSRVTDLLSEKRKNLYGFSCKKISTE